MTIVLFAVGLVAFIAALTVALSRRRNSAAEHGTEGWETEREHTLRSKRSGGIFGAHGTGADLTGGLNAQEHKRYYK